MESQITKILNANNAHSCYSSSELQLLSEYFCDDTDMSSEDASDSGEEFAVSDDSTDPCCVPSTTKKQKLWTSVPAASASTTSTTAVESTSVPVSEDLLSNLGQSTSELFLSASLYVSKRGAY